MLDKLGKLVIKNEWLVVLAAVTIMMRIPSLFEPYWYGDEGIYLSIGQAMNRGLALYSQIHDNKPPLLYLVAAAAGGNLFWAKFILLIWGTVTIGVFAGLAKKVFKGNGKKVITSTIVFSLLTTLPITEGNIVNAELFFLLPLTAAVWLLWEKNPKSKNIVLAGGLIGLAALFKVPAIFEAGLWPLIWLVTQDKKKVRNIMLLGLGAALPIIGSGIYFWTAGSLNEYITAAWTQNIPYLSTWKTSGEETGIFSIKGRVIVLAILLAFLSGGHKKIGRTNLILGNWFAISLFAALLSGRPYPHYLVQSITSMSLLGAGVMFGLKKDKVVGIVSIGILVLTIKLFKFYSYNPVTYYGNFLSWVAGKKTTTQFQGQFDPNVNAIYEIAEIIKTETSREERIFVWGDLPMIYALTDRLPVGKYTAKYHILSFKEQETTMQLLHQVRPRIVVVVDSDTDLPGLNTLLTDDYYLEKEIRNIQVYRRYKKI